MNPSILLFNVHSYHNAGDAALTEEALRQIKANFSDCQISIMLNDPASYSGDHLILLSFLSWVVQSSKRRRMRFFWITVMGFLTIALYRITGKSISLVCSNEMDKSIRGMLNSDILVGTAGGYYYSYGQGRMFLLQILTLAFMIFTGKPVYLLPQSYGPLHYKYEHWLVRWLLPKIRILMAREPISLESLASWGVPNSKVYLLPDPAFSFTGQSSIAAIEWLSKHGVDIETCRPLLGTTIMDWGAQDVTFHHQDSYEDAIVAAINYFIDQLHGMVVILPQCTGPSRFEDDRIPSQRIVDRLKDQLSSILLIDSELPPTLLWSIYGQMDLLIGTRMHSNIFAMSQNIPVIPIGYLHKTMGIALSLGIDRWVIDIHEIDEARLIAKIEQLWSELAEMRQHLTQTIPSQIELCLKIGTIIAGDYDQYKRKRIQSAD